MVEIYKGANTTAAKLAEKYASRKGLRLLCVPEHRELCENAGHEDVRVTEKRDKGWICTAGRNPLANSSARAPESYGQLRKVCQAPLGGRQHVLAHRNTPFNPEGLGDAP